MSLAMLHSLAKTKGVIPVDLTDRNIYIRKYIRPVRWSTNKEQERSPDAPAAKPEKIKNKSI